MTEPDVVRSWKNEEDGDQPTDHPSGTIRLLPLATFGMRAAALTGMIVGVGGALGQLTGMDSTTGMGNTCCYPH